MDVILAFDPQNYPVLVNGNPQFVECLTSYIRRHNILEATSKKRVKRILTENQEQLNNCILLIFGPFVASLRLLRDNPGLFASPPPPLVGSDTRMVHEEFLDHTFLYLADVNNFIIDQKRMETNLKTFIQMVKFLFGATPCQMKKDSQQTHLLKAMFDTWLSARDSPVYMLEAMERLLVSRSIQITFTRLLQSLLIKTRETLKADSEETPCHVLLFVDLKLLSHFNSRNTRQIGNSDMLLLLLLLNTANELKQAVGEKSSVNSVEEDYDGDYDSASSTGSFENESKSSTSSKWEKRISKLFWKKPTEPTKNIPNNERCYRENCYQQFLVFLHLDREENELMVPYCVRLFKVSDRVSVLQLSQVPAKALALNIHVLLDIMDCLQYRQNLLKGFPTLYQLNLCVKRLRKQLNHKRYRNARSIIPKLEQLSRSDCLKTLVVNIDNQELPSNIDALCFSICNSLRAVYQQFVCDFLRTEVEMLARNPRVEAGLINMKEYATHAMGDYLEYLEVKSDRNMTVDPYKDLIPGLVAFLYVDRSSNELVACVQSSNDDLVTAVGDNNIFQSILCTEVLPQAIQTAHSKLASGKLSCKWTANGLSFCYFMWFEDLSGNTLKPESFDFKLCSVPGVLTNGFHVVSHFFPTNSKPHIPAGQRKSIQCCELLLLRNVSKTDVWDSLSTAKRLAAKLWEVTSCSNDRFIVL